jgi:hypothetical protein
MLPVPELCSSLDGEVRPPFSARQHNRLLEGIADVAVCLELVENIGYDDLGLRPDKVAAPRRMDQIALGAPSGADAGCGAGAANRLVVRRAVSE